MKMYSEEEVIEILEKLEAMGYDEESGILNDLTIEQLDEYVHGRTN